MVAILDFNMAANWPPRIRVKQIDKDLVRITLHVLLGLRISFYTFVVIDGRYLGLADQWEYYVTCISGTLTQADSM